MDRSAKNGFRCALYPHPEQIPSVAFAEVKEEEVADFFKEKPVSDSLFKLYRELYSYDKTDLKARVESREERQNWVHELVSFEAVYGGERGLAHLFLPKNSTPPFQRVVYFPEIGSQWFRSSQDLENFFEFTVFLSFIVKSGQAVIYPVYKGTFERVTDNTSAVINGDVDSPQFAELSIQWVKDLKRSIDYLETRPEIDEVNFIGRVRIPTLMLNGRYDTINPYENTIKPMFDLLGTPANEKRLVSDETDHIPSVNIMIKETLAWLDKYLGPVKR